MIFKPNQKISFQGKNLSLDDAVLMASEFIGKKQFEVCQPLAVKLVQVFPQSDSANQIMGIVLGEQGRHAEAVEFCRKAIELNPTSAKHKNSLANYLVELRQLTEAEALYQEAAKIDPGYPDPTYNLAKMYLTQQRYPEAEHYFQTALLFAPNQGEIYQNLGVCKFNQGLYSHALLWFKLANSLLPSDADLYYNMAHCHLEVLQTDEAIELFNAALELDPYRYDILLCLATAYYKRNDFRMAEEFGRAYLNHLVDENGDSTDILSAKMFMSGICKAQGRHLEAIEWHKEIIEEFPTESVPYNNMLLDCVYTDKLSKQELVELHQEFSNRFEKGLPQCLHLNDRNKSRKLRVGYVSADYFNHAVAYLALPLIARHDKTNFEVFCYYNNKTYSPVTNQFMRSATWRQVDLMSDAELAEKIQEDQIDILIDLSGHTGYNRLLTFARKPAPIQASWLGYPFSTGIKAIDYRIVDRFIEDEVTDNQTTGEQLFFLDKCFAAYRPSIAFPDRIYSGELDVRPTPALKNGFVTFGCCNNIAKITEHSIALWAQILKRMETSKLMLEIHDPENPLVRENIAEKFGVHGISLDRLILSDRKKNKQYSLYHDIDIVLDPTPCNGGNTTCDSLWMSVPMVSLVGDRYMSRMGLTFLTNIGHPEWLAYTDQQYVDIACDMAKDIDALNNIRQKLRSEVEDSPLMDEVGFARRMENAYRQMWEKWCDSDDQRLEAVKPATQAENTIAKIAQSNGAAKKSGIVRAERSSHTAEELAMVHLVQLFKQESWAELIQHAEAFLIRFPAYPKDSVLHLKGVALSGLGLFQQAQEVLEAAIALNHEDPGYYNSLGNMHLGNKAYADAEAAYKKALELNPSLTQATHNLGVVFMHQAQMVSLASSEANLWLDQATNFFQQTISLDPSHIHAWNNLCSLQMYRNRRNEAEVAVRRALRINPDFVPALNNLSTLLYYKDKYGEAIKTLEHAYAIAPDEAVVVHNLANLYAKDARVDEAIELGKKALALEPDNLEYQHSFLLNIVYSDKMSLEERLAHYAAFSARVPRPEQNYLHLNDPDPSRKIRLGFVSGDFKIHSVSYSTYPLFELIDKSKFELFFYYNGDQYDKITSRFSHDYATEWRNTRGVNHEVMDALVREDKIDILIDLSGHTGHSFLPAFAYKPAPVQVTWLGYPETTGLSEVDYRITDSVAHPDAEAVQATFTEQLYRLSEGVPFAVYRPYVANPERHHMHVFEVQPTPALKNEFITFGCGSNIIRLNDYTIQLWAQVMARVENSKLLLDCKELPEHILSKFEAHGIDRSRVSSLGRDAALQYRFYHHIDIALDAFPCNGGTTSFDTLWMGVPLVTQAGDRFASRIGASLLTHLGHPEWIANAESEFIEIAVSLAGDVTKLDDIRQQLRPQMKASPLMNEVSFTRAFERALTSMWCKWCESYEASLVREHFLRSEMLGLSSELLAQGEYDMAWDAYRAVLSKWPTSGEALYGAGLVALLQNHVEPATELLQRGAQALQAENAGVDLQADCLAALGQALLQQNDPDSAALHLHHSLALKESAAVREWLGLVPNSANKIN